MGSSFGGFTWKVPLAPFPVIRSSCPRSTALTRADLSTSGLETIAATFRPQHAAQRGRSSQLPALDLEVGKVLLQVLPDEVVRGLLGLTEPSDDERKSVSQRLHLLTSFLEATREVPEHVTSSPPRQQAALQRLEHGGSSPNTKRR